jgi:flotillin
VKLIKIAVVAATILALTGCSDQSDPEVSVNSASQEAEASQKAEAEAKRKIAEAFEMYGQAATLDMIVKMLPEYAREIASPLANIDKITVVDTGGGEGGGANKVTSYATNLMSTLQETLKESSGIDVKEMLENLTGKSDYSQTIEQLRYELEEKNRVIEQQEV